MEQYCVAQANMIAISLFCTAHIVMKDSLQFELFDGDGLHTFQVAIFQRSVKYLFSWRVRSLPKSYHFGDNRTLKNIWKWMGWSLGQTNNPIFFGFWSNRIFVQCTNFLVPCKATPVRTSIEKFLLAIWRNRRSNFISLGQHTKKGAIFTWNISIQKSHLTLILVKIMRFWSLAQVGGIIYPVAIKYDSKFGDAFWNRCQLSSRQWHLMIILMFCLK